MMLNPVKRRSIFCGFLAVIFFSSCKFQQKSGAVAEIHEGDRLTSFSQEITSRINQFEVKPGEIYTLEIKVKNTGTQPWFGGKGQPDSITVGYRWLDNKENGVFGTNRALLDRPVVRPGESDELKLQVVGPPTSGSYTLWISMVQEGVDWFYARGTKPLALQVTVD